MTNFRRLAGLPAYGAPAVPVPAAWGRWGREGVVVEFTPTGGGRWVGNFACGDGGATAVVAHPDGRHVLVLAEGTLWRVDPESRTADELAAGVDVLWPVHDPDGFVLSMQGLAFLRLGPSGSVWHTRRLSWDGLRAVQLSTDALRGDAWSAIGERWVPFEIDLATGESEGGAFGAGDPEGWEQLASRREPGEVANRERDSVKCKRPSTF